MDQVCTAADVYVRNKPGEEFHSGNIRDFLEDVLYINSDLRLSQEKLLFKTVVSIFENMAGRGKFDNMAPVSAKGEKRKEQFNSMMAKRFGSSGRDVAAELRTIGEFPNIECSLSILYR